MRRHAPLIVMGENRPSNGQILSTEWVESAHDDTALGFIELLRGRMLENFVGMELVKQIGYAPAPYRLYHLRTSKGREVDFIIEDEAGRLLGVEVKASATLRSDDFRHLRALAEWVPERWASGVVLYLGETQLPFGKGFWALPITSLWHRNAETAGL